jgi:NitT/TauT family transport system substrate-binding protein
VRALIAAAERLNAEPETAWLLVAKAADLEIETVRDAGPRFTYPGTLAPDLLDVLEREEPWVAAMQNRAPRDRETLAALIDAGVLREALGG